MKKITFLAVTVLTFITTFAQDIAYTPAMRDSLINKHNIPESSIQIKFFGNAKLTEVAPAEQLIANKKGEIVSVRQGKLDEKVFPNLEQGLMGVIVDTLVLLDTTNVLDPNTLEFKVKRTTVILAEFDKFPGFRLPFMVNGEGSGAENNRYVLATIKYQKRLLDIDGKQYKLTGDGKLSYSKGKAKKPGVKSKVAKGKKVGK